MRSASTGEKSISAFVLLQNDALGILLPRNEFAG